MSKTTKQFLASLIPGQRVFWTDPDGGSLSGIRSIHSIDAEPEHRDETTKVYLRVNGSESVRQCLASELTPIESKQMVMTFVADYTGDVFTMKNLANALHVKALDHMEDGLLFQPGVEFGGSHCIIAEGTATAQALQSALDRAISFIAGFEDDPDQEGVIELLADLRKCHAMPVSEPPADPIVPNVVIEFTGENLQVSADADVNVTLVDYTWDEAPEAPIPGRDEEALVEEVTVILDPAFCRGVKGVQRELNAKCDLPF